ncbi:hypothetical protein SO802_029641 [Lithocarpus litseifolius]|uniref:Uncharacterized protein n=1 Tax=Lithocarpus litseifolius TaxID=425828 RepID=A0AAW2BW99_9ROSI
MSKAGQSTNLCYKATEERYKTKGAYIILEPPNFGNQKFLTFEAVTLRSKVALRNLTTQVNEGALQISQDHMFVEVFGPERHGRVCGYGARITPTKLWGSSSSRMYDLEKATPRI